MQLTVRETGAQNAPRPSVQVVIHDSAEVPADVLNAARSLANGVFIKAGVEVNWNGDDGSATSCAAAGGASFCIQVLLRPRHPEFTPAARRVMGVALAADGQRAVLSLYFDAVTAVARRYGSPRELVLGLALAHEMGHVLLPPPSHSATGIMQPSWEGDDLRHVLVGDAAFTENQARAMRERLERRP